MKYKTESHPNSNCLSIHVDRRLPDYSTIFVLDELDAEDMSMFRELENIDGVSDVVTCDGGYRLQLCKGEQFEWPPIVTATVEILLRRYQPSGSAVCLDADPAH